jgi:hypothetical protein
VDHVRMKARICPRQEQRHGEGGRDCRGARLRPPLGHIGTTLGAPGHEHRSAMKRCEDEIEGRKKTVKPNQ